MVLGYISAIRDSVDNIKFEIQQYAKKNKLKLDEIAVDEVSDRSSWEKRALYSFIHEASQGDVFVLFEASDIARSTSQVLEALEIMLEQGITVHFVKYNKVFKATQEVNVIDILTLMQHIESDFVAKRTTEALARRRAAGLPLGRPRGKLNKSLKLDKYKKDIMRYLELKISKASIAKLVGCHPQTLYNYLEKRNLADHIDEEVQHHEVEQYEHERELEPLD
jgi:DNA invertase Pin-like site-specific DNA recombinase